ncbi:DUF3052 domain-containing protein [Nakamurella silvestris]|nr:DUF3052 domain-containing protein [Nakamurella silvestris]
MSAPGYSGTPLPRKLGITPHSRVLVVGDPLELDLDLLRPEGAPPAHRRPGREPYDVVLLFCTGRAALEASFDRAAARHTQAGMIWVCWPKKASGVPTDLGDGVVREYGLAHGRVDVKVAAISEVWSGLKFVIRVADRTS